MTDNKPYPDLHQIIRDAGGIVHSDGNIFFKSAVDFCAAADRAMRAAEPAVAQAAPVAVAPDSNHDALRCAVGNCTFNGEVTQHAATCPKKPAAVAGPDCQRCKGSGEDPEGYYDQSRGPDGDTHDGPCRACGGSGEAPTTQAPAVAGPVTWTPGPNEFKDWCAHWFGPDSDDDYLAKAVFDLPPLAQRFGRATQAAPQPAAPPHQIAKAATHAMSDFEVTESIIHKCPALRLPQSFVQHLGMTAQIVALKGATPEIAEFIADACNKATEAATQPQESAPTGIVEAEAAAFASTNEPTALLRHWFRKGYAMAKEAAPSQDALTKAAKDVLAERLRQINVEGWTPEHDDEEHLPDELALAAASYVCADAGDAPPAIWPWDRNWWKPRDRRRNLVKSGALILAELERLDRAEARAQAKEGTA